jgi:hypothetical protein
MQKVLNKIFSKINIKKSSLPLSVSSLTFFAMKNSFSPHWVFFTNVHCGNWKATKNANFPVLMSVSSLTFFAIKTAFAFPIGKYRRLIKDDPVEKLGNHLSAVRHSSETGDAKPTAGANKQTDEGDRG